MKKISLVMVAMALAFAGCRSQRNINSSTQSQTANADVPVVYFTTNITPDALVRIYKALGVNAEGRVAVKISTGETGKSNQLKPELIKNLVQLVNGTLVECNTAYAGTRMHTADHQKEIDKRGYRNIATVDIMDAEGEMRIPVRDTTYMKYNIVGSHLQNYDFMINLAHFKGHQMGGFGGVLKNQSIGVASSNGKAYIHSNGITQDAANLWKNILPENQDKFLECMATAATAVHDYFEGRVLYIAVMNNISIDCDCNGNPAKPELKDMGILASTDPVALDQACIDLVYRHHNTAGDDASSLIRRIEKQHGIHTIEHAEKIGLGSRKYQLKSIDNKQ